jgi:hypothetical protein
VLSFSINKDAKVFVAINKVMLESRRDGRANMGVENQHGRRVQVPSNDQALVKMGRRRSR